MRVTSLLQDQRLDYKPQPMSKNKMKQGKKHQCGGTLKIITDYMAPVSVFEHEFCRGCARCDK